MSFRINTVIYSLLAIMAFPPATVLAQSNSALFDAPWRAFGTGDFPAFKPEFFDMGDIDGDGDLDVVVSHSMFSGPGMAVLVSNGDGSFAEEVNYRLNTNPSEATGEVVLVDFDMDGDLDVIGTIPGDAGFGTRIAVWRNNGDGTYAPPSRFTTGEGPIGLVVGDFTGDGFPDVVTADFGFISGSNDTISLLRHNGQTGNGAGFLFRRLIHVGDNSRRVAAADIDNDGDLDLVVGRGNFIGRPPDGINVLTNDGAGNFVVGPSFASIPGADRASPAVVLADLDNDGDFDLITGGADQGGISHGQIAIRLNDGAGSFGAPEVHDLGRNTFTPHSINVGDLNGDGLIDIIASTPSGRSVDGWNLLMSTSNGGFQPVEFFGAAKQTFDLAAFDADSDGDLDVVTVADDSSVITVHENHGGGNFLAPTLWPLNALNRDMDFGDIDNDGDLDLVTTNGSIYYLRNNSDGTFAPVIHRTIPIGAGEVKLRDMNNDGFLDLLMISHPFDPPYNFAVSLNNGNGTFAAGVVTVVNACQGGQIDAFDLDNDGDLDVALTEPGTCPGNQAHIYIARNNGNGTSLNVVTGLSGFGLPNRIAGADLDHDGNIDLVSATSLGMTVFPGNGNLTFAPHRVVGTGGVFDFVLADINLDGNEDLCMLLPPQDGSFGTAAVGIQLGRGDLTFGSRTTYRGPNGLEPGFRFYSEIEATDINGDGFADIILSSNGPGDVSVFLSNGDGTLQPQDRYGLGNSAQHALAGDFTGDGIVDIAAVVFRPPFVLDDAAVVISGLPESTPGVPSDLIDLSIPTGTLLDGGLLDLESSDDSYVHTRSGFGSTLVDLHNMEMRINATTTVQSPASLDLTIESRIDQPAGIAQIGLLNHGTQKVDSVGQYALGNTDAIDTILGLDATNYVSSAGDIELSVKQLVFVPFLAFTFESFIDQVEIVVR